MLAIETQDLAHAYDGSVVLHPLDLRVEAGARHGFLGLNGAGKSTTIRILTGLLSPTSGRAFVLGRDVARSAPGPRARIGHVGDEGLACAPTWTVREYLETFARFHGDARPPAEALDLVGFERSLSLRALATLSTGQRRRVELARALLGRPSILFLDEPTRGLDLPGKRDVWRLLRDLNEREGVTLFVTSHETAEVRATCETLTTLARGRVTFDGRVRDLGRDDDALESALIGLMTKDGTAPVGRP